MSGRGGRLRLDGYVRVSKVAGREGASFISPDDQRERIAAWAVSRGVEIAEWHVDLDQTGGKLSRPGLDRLMDRIRAKETGGVAVAYVDRLSRADVGDALKLVAEIHDLGGELAALDLGIDPTTPFGEFGMTILLGLGRMQRRRIAEGWKVATGRAVARGVHAHVPFGYIKTGKGKPLEPDEETRGLVVELFQRRGTGESWQRLADLLNEAGVPSAHGGRWTRRSVETIVRNRAYLGEARYGKHVNPVAHEPLVAAGLWDAAQEARGARPAAGPPALLSGLVRCTGCRYRMVPATVGQAKVRIYRCKGTHGAGQCPAPAYVQRGLLEEFVERAFLEHYVSLGAEGKVSDPGLSAARERLEATEAELVAYRDNASAREVLNALGGGHFEAGLQTRARAVVEAREEMQRARHAASGFDLGPAGDIWPELPVADRRKVMLQGIDAVFLRRSGGQVRGRRVGLDPARVRVLWRGESPGDLPGPGLRPEFRGFEW